jgi:thermitase
LNWKHCFFIYEFREVFVGLRRAGNEVGAATRELRIRARFEHALCPMGRKQGPIVHSLTLLPQEEVRIYEYDRYQRTTSTSARFSQRSSFFTYVSRVTDVLASVKTDAGASFSRTDSAAGEAGGGIDLGIISFGGGASASSSVSAEGHLNVDTVFETFSHTAVIASQAVETERSIVVSTSTTQESVDTVYRTLRNDNHCRAVTYFIRRVLEVYCLTTRLVQIEVQIGNNWIDIDALPPATRDAIMKQLGPVLVGQVAGTTAEIAIPTDGLLYEAELAHCTSCEPELERRIDLELKKLELELELLARENERRKARVAAGDYAEFETVPEPVPQP